MKFQFTADYFVAGPNVNYPAVLVETPTSTNPSLVPTYADLNTGLGWDGADNLSIVVGGIEMAHFDQDNSLIVIPTGTNVTFTNGGGLASNTTCVWLYSPDGTGRVEACNT